MIEELLENAEKQLNKMEKIVISLYKDYPKSLIVFGLIILVIVGLAFNGWEALSAIGTVGAVVVSLWLARKEPDRKAKMSTQNPILLANLTTDSLSDSTEFTLKTTLINSGNIPGVVDYMYIQATSEEDDMTIGIGVDQEQLNSNVIGANGSLSIKVPVEDFAIDCRIRIINDEPYYVRGIVIEDEIGNLSFMQLDSFKLIVKYTNGNETRDSIKLDETMQFGRTNLNELGRERY